MPAWTHRVGFWRKEEVLKLVGKEEKARAGKKNKSNKEMEETMWAQTQGNNECGGVRFMAQQFQT